MLNLHTENISSIDPGGSGKEINLDETFKLLKEPNKFALKKLIKAQSQICMFLYAGVYCSNK